MIVYDLQCPQNHIFEGWFEDADTFEQQQKQGLIACPVCNDTQIVRIPSTFAIKGAPSRMSHSPQMDAALIARSIADYMENNFDNVGADFAKEALKIHYGVSEPRNIRGVSTTQEEETLRQEGVSFFKLPLPSANPPDPGASSDPSSESNN